MDKVEIDDDSSSHGSEFVDATQFQNNANKVMDQYDNLNKT